MPENLLKSRLVQGVESVLPLNTDFTSYNEDTKKRRIFGPETGLSRQKTCTDRPCSQCGKTTSGTVCRACYQALRKVLVLVTCGQCQASFKLPRCEFEKKVRRGQKHVFCTETCSQKFNSENTRKRCAVCPAFVPDRHLKYCSSQCRQSVTKTPDIPCQMCQKPFHPVSPRRMYCSSVCSSKAHSQRMHGSGNSHFKLGDSYSKVFNDLRGTILGRDGERCVVCKRQDTRSPVNRKDRPQGATKSVLVVHHIDEDHTNNVTTNLITLCAPCHMKHHKGTPFDWFPEYIQRISLSTTSK